MASDLKGFLNKLDKAAKALAPSEVNKILTDAGKAGVGDVEGAVRKTLGDMSMSNWRRGAPIQIKARYDLGVRMVAVTPERRARGPMRVLEDGRQAAVRGERRATGRTSKKTGKALTRKVKRTAGSTAGKRTWSDATQLLAKRMPKRLADPTVKRVFDAFR